MTTNRSWSSGSWYRVAGYRPSLRHHTSIYRHVYRGEIWYVLQDRSSGRFHRFTPEAHRLIAMMDGRRTLEQIWQLACEQLPTDAVTQDELTSLVGRLYTADVLRGDVPADIQELSERGRRTRRQKLVRSILNPLALRLPIIDPDEFLNATMPLIRPLFSVFGALAWLAVVGYGGVLVALNWAPLTENVIDRVLASENLLLLLLAYPSVKAVHELGHAYTIKRWGGTVHEIGIMFLVFMPVPYVDASDSAAFASKWRRALVGSAGIIVELFLAAIAMIVWVDAEEGFARAFAFNVMLIGGVSTLLFNGNPLLRFDGYYVLCDLIEIPNLGQRANRYLAYLLQRYVFGIQWSENPVTARGEPAWFLVYAIASFVYRLTVTFAIVGLVATQFFIVGVILAIWAVFLMLVLPVLKMGWFLLNSPMLRRKRGRALAATAALLGALAAVLLAVPLPHNTMAEGVVAPGPEAYVNAGGEGTIAEVFVQPGETVRAGTPLVRIDDPLIESQQHVLEARVGELQERLAAELPNDQVAVRIMREELKTAEANLANIRSRIADLTLKAGADGRVIMATPEDLVGRYVQPGQPLAVVARFEDPLIRVVVPESQANLVQRNTKALQVRFVSALDRVYPAHVVRATPSVTRDLPSLALSTEGGGTIALDPNSPQGARKALTGLYHLEVKLDEPRSVLAYGDRVYVRFSHDDTPLAQRLYRAALQVFLRYFSVVS
ncbi:MAG: HlyD family efflux transporter periplasmic adaptor subunit [Alphaproteobacteria bacterium]|nr:HlyD family efflux transporter periplasmic adaptor subunit [Alphaproteobacteria bacterium]MCB9928997.1 HlyD family efflux transporter periplasmic adaptor subunit [Alphaproteobacteria bacterium]